MAKKPAPIYRTYQFTEKDPMIDKIRTVISDSSMKHREIQEKSGVTTATLWNWFFGKTQRPQFATLNAVAVACGCELVLAPKSQNTATSYRLPQRRQQRRRAYHRQHIHQPTV